MASAITGCVSISLVGIPIGIVSSAEGLTIYGITPGIKKFKSTIKKKKKHNKIVLFAKTRLNTAEVLISRVLINSYINYSKLTAVMCHKSRMK